ncbi:MAG: hypothetical protein ACRCVJ_06645 [Clostridium sp.]|uniref:hypothetical protein n=1 Tax=Clostridium sp. TaxID=1506 RepID=UPI003F400BA6
MGKFRKGYILFLIVSSIMFIGCSDNGFKSIIDNTKENNSKAVAGGIIKENNTDYESVGFKDGKLFLYAFSNENLKKEETYYFDNKGVLNVTGEKIYRDDMIDELIYQNSTENHNIKTVKSDNFNEENILPKAILDGSSLKLNKLNDEDRGTSLDYVTGNMNYYIYEIFQNGKQELVIINGKTNEFYVSELLDLARENTEYRNIKSVFYDKGTDSIYGINPDGKIKKLILENKKIKIEDYDKIRTDKNEYVNKVISSNEDNYIEFLTSDDGGSSTYVSRILKYDITNKDYKNVYKDKKDNDINTLNYTDGFFLLSEGSNIKNYYLCKFNGDGIEKIRKVSEDKEDENSNTYIYTNKKNNLVFVKKDYVGTDDKRVQDFKVYNIYDQ